MLYSVAPRRKRSRSKNFEIVTVAPWTDSGAVDTSKIIQGKRQRKEVAYSK